MKKNLIYFLVFFGLYSYGQELNNLELQFKNPPQSAKPYVWWHWMGSNFSKSGITKDLEAMKASGIGGATIFNLSSAVQESQAPTLNNPWPEQTYRSSAYWDALKFAASEAKRLGLELGLHNTVGYSTTGGSWVSQEQSMQHLVWSDTIITGNGKARQIQLTKPLLKADKGWGRYDSKLSFYKDVVVMAIPADKQQAELADVKILTLNFDSIKGLLLPIPKGQKWKIYRFGHASTGISPHPVPDDVIGKTLEVDKMSTKQSEYHWSEVLNPISQNLGEFIPGSFKHILIDSYEAGNQNWTPGFREEFIHRKGYDPLPWLLTFVQTVTNDKKNSNRRVLDSEEKAARFEWDYRDVINQLYMENGFSICKKMINQAGLRFDWEPYSGPFNTTQGSALADLPMGEFWSNSNGGINLSIPAAARAENKPLVGAEAFTGRPEVSNFTETPALLKKSTDGAFLSGVNRLILHHWVHQPFDDKYQPGMCMGWWGTHFGRFQTWFEPGKEFFKYIARCQFLLQQGQGVVDYLCVDKLVGNADLLSVNDFMNENISIRNGQVLLPSGRSYPFIVYSDTLILPEVAEKLVNLAMQGATVVCPRPVHSPGLQNYPGCDQNLQKLAYSIWKNQPINPCGKGFVISDLKVAIQKEGITRDYQVLKDSANEIKVTHRRANGMDLYFVVNTGKQIRYNGISFRITGKQPELWQAEDASIQPASVWSDDGKRTTVNVKLNPQQSVFVVFRKTPLLVDHLTEAKADTITDDWSIHCDSAGNSYFSSNENVKINFISASGLKSSMSVKTTQYKMPNQSWNVTFIPKKGYSFERKLPDLIDFSTSEDKDIKYFSGTAVYKKVIRIGNMLENQRFFLDLGKVYDLAQVKVNDAEKVTLWYPPFKADITKGMRVGENIITIEITNTWANRLIGDEQEPADFEWGNDRGETKGRALLAYPTWFLKNESRPSQGRKAFSTWYYFRSNSQLKPAGLVGPVRFYEKGETIIK